MFAPNDPDKRHVNSFFISNAKIFTNNPDQPWAEAVLYHEGRIVAVGSNDDVLILAEDGDEGIDAQQRLVLPGLIDSHVHFLQYAERRHQVNLFGVRDFDEVLRRVRVAVEQAAPGQWVQGWGWDENLWDVAPTAAHLDPISADVPVVLARMDMHTWWVNSAAMRAVNLTADTPGLPESHIDRYADGQPTGLLREWNAIVLVADHIPPLDQATRRQWLIEAMQEAHQLGLTGIHDQRVEHEGRDSWRLWQSLRHANELTLRVHANIAADFLPQLNTLGFQAGFGDERLWMGHAKTFIDGTLGSRTAWMLAPFENDPDNTGIVVTPPSELAEIAQLAQKAGFPLTIHAIGDRAVREVIDVLADYPSSSPLPHRIEHVQVIDPADIARFAELQITASMQPIHLATDWATADKLWGARGQYTYAFRTLLEAGTQLAFGSDAPVAPLNPFLGIHAAVTREDGDGQPAGGWYPAEKLPLEEAIAAYTIAPAALSAQGHQQGRIQPGYWADMVIVSDNLFEIDPTEIAQATADVTIIGGEVVWRKG